MIICDFTVETTDDTPTRFDRGSVFMVFEYCDFDLTGLMESGVVSITFISSMDLSSRLAHIPYACEIVYEAAALWGALYARQ